MSRTLNLGIPSGSLQNACAELFEKAGYRIAFAERSYYPDIDDPDIDCLLVRAQEMARYVEQGVLDAGITGHDWVRETEADVAELAEFVFAKASRQPSRWVLCVPNDSPARSVRDLAGKRIATEVVNLTRRYLQRHGVEATVEFSWGATEVKPPRLADAVVEITETGGSLRANNLRVLDEVLASTPRLVANRQAVADPWKKAKLDNIALMLASCLAAEGRVGLMMNVRQGDLAAVAALLPALRNPTISHLSDPEWVAVSTIIEEAAVRTLVPALKKAGATGIVEFPINKVIE